MKSIFAVAFLFSHIQDNSPRSIALAQGEGGGHPFAEIHCDTKKKLSSGPSQAKAIMCMKRMKEAPGQQKRERTGGGRGKEALPLRLIAAETPLATVLWPCTHLPQAGQAVVMRAMLPCLS